MSRLVQGREVLAAIEASSMRARELGIDEALRELGIEPDQLRLACMNDAPDWMMHLPARPTFGEVAALVASSQMVGTTAGVRLGRMYPTNEPTATATEAELRAVAAQLRALARADEAPVSGALLDLANRIDAAIGEGS